jgi:general secretion pathway protein J
MKPARQRKQRPRRSQQGRFGPRAGFSFIEVLAALAITAGIAATVLPYLGRLIANWSRGEAVITAQDQWMQAMLRLSEDFGEALPLTLNNGENRAGDPPRLAFSASPRTIVFVRPALTDKGGNQLETVRLSIESNARGDALLRGTSDFTPESFAANADMAETVILSGRFRLSFGVVDASPQNVSQGNQVNKGNQGNQANQGKEMPLRVTLSGEPIGDSIGPFGPPLVFPIAARLPPSQVVTPDGAGAINRR